MIKFAHNVSMILKKNIQSKTKSKKREEEEGLVADGMCVKIKLFLFIIQ